MVNSRLGLITATPSSFLQPRRVDSPGRALLLPKLRSYFAEFLNESYLERLRILSPPTCVGFSTVTSRTRIEAFLDSTASTSSPTKWAPHNPSEYVAAGFSWRPSYRFKRTFLIVRWSSPLCPPIAQTPEKWHRNINPLSIGYALRPRLRSRLTLGGLAFPRKP